MPATVVRNSKYCKVNFYVTETGTPLMGMYLITAHKLRIEGDKVLSASNPPVSSPVMQLSKAEAQAPTVGCVEGLMHKVKVSQSAIPVRQKLRRLPFAVRSDVSDELNRLSSAGVIERIDASP